MVAGQAGRSLPPLQGSARGSIRNFQGSAGLTSDQRLRRTYPHVADLPERPRGYGHEYDAIHEWLVRRLGSPLSGRWYLLGLRAYFANEADCMAFCQAWGAKAR